ncbi:MAG TPA: hypothetical protein VFE31_00360 [Opitutaceae bacterium]|nr:hypothetical protein [Opitutaceae bacterium]
MNVAQLPSSALAPAVPLGLLPAGARFVVPLDRRADFAGSTLSPIEWPFIFAVVSHDRAARLVTVHPEGKGPVHQLFASTLVRPLIGPAPAHPYSHAPLRSADRRESLEEDAYEVERERMRTGEPSLAAELALDAREPRTAARLQEGDYSSPSR